MLPLAGWYGSIRVLCRSEISFSFKFICAGIRASKIYFQPAASANQDALTSSDVDKNHRTCC
jgi:hypothetical protein